MSKDSYKIKLIVNKLNVYKDPNSSAKVVSEITDDKFYTIVCTEGRYGKLSEVDGWVYLNKTEKLSESENLDNSADIVETQSDNLTIAEDNDSTTFNTQEMQIESTEHNSDHVDSIELNMICNFNGGMCYSSPWIELGRPVKGKGKVKVTRICDEYICKHMYHVVHLDDQCDVLGWVNIDSLSIE